MLLSVLLFIIWIIRCDVVCAESTDVKYITLLSSQFNKDQVIYTSNSESVSITYKLDLTSSNYCPEDVFALNSSIGTLSILQTISHHNNTVMCSNTDSDQYYQPVLKSYHCYIIKTSHLSSSSLLLIIDVIPDTNLIDWEYSQTLFRAKSIGVAASGLIYTDNILQGISTELFLSSVLLDYSIVSIDDASESPLPFSIQQDTVQCSSFAKLHSNSTLHSPSYNLTLQITSPSSSTSTTTLLIEVTYPNFYPPKIINNISTLTLPYNTPRMSVVVTLKSVDNDILGPASSLRYNITNEGNVFGINPVNGDIMLLGEITGSTWYNVTVMIQDIGVPVLSIESTIMIFIETYDELNLSINVTDTSSVGELTPIQTTVATIVVQGLDSLNISVDLLCGFSSNSFQLIQQNTTDLYINETTQYYDVILIEPLNYELMRTHYCNVVVTDSESSTTTEKQMVVHVTNENDPPYFHYSIYSATIPENAALDTSIMIIAAQDEDISDQLSYSIVTNYAKEFFAINSHSGLIYTINKLQTDVIVMNISVSDGLHSDYTLANITITSVDMSPPMFQAPMFVISIYENIPNSEPLFSFSATDSDQGCSGAVQYTIAQAEPPFFTIDTVSGLLYVDSTTILDYEQFTTALITVQATSLGKYGDQYSTTVLNLTILNINDNAPIIDPIDCLCFMDEETDTVQYCQELRSIDKDGDTFTYQFQSGSNEFFDINSSTGVVSTKTRLDHEILSIHELYIIAIDNEHVSDPVKLVIQVLDVNDSPPLYTSDSITITLPQDTPIGSTIGNVGATQYDVGFNAITKHTFSSNTPQSVTNMFILDPLSAELTLSEMVTSVMTYTFDILAYDVLNSSQQASISVQIIVDGVTNTVPYFPLTNDRILVANNLPLESVVTTLTAIDEENDIIVYSLNNSVFGINSNTGIITLSDSLFELTYILNVSATDGLLTTHLLLTIIVYQPITIISDIEYTYNTGVGVCLYTGFVTEGMVPNGDHVVTMTTMQGGQLISYDIIDGEYMDMFEISQGNIVTTIAGNINFNRSLYEAIFLTIRATYGSSLFHLCSLTIIINDINDNGPVFSSSLYNVEIYQPTPMGSSIFKFQATDSDYGVNAISSYSLLTESIPFSVNNKTGHTRLTGLLTEDHYTITVLATDSQNISLNDTTKLIITVLSIVNNPPMFNEDIIHISIPETEPLHSVITTITGTDTDIGVHSSLNYCVLYGTSHFSIDSNGGQVSVTDLLDYEMSNEHNVSIFVFDNSLNTRMAQTTLNIIILDVNDEIPTFLTTNYFSAILEGTSKDMLILTVTARDRDTGVNGIIHYSLLNNSYFSINSSTGDIATATIIDREALDNDIITLTVMATDQGSNSITLSSTATVNIQITDINDYRPRFIESLSSIVVTILETNRIDDIVYTVLATDDDYGLNGEVRYTIDDNNLIFIDSVSGNIFLQKNVDIETDNNHYEFEITATDLGANPLSKSIIMTFDVINVNDNNPKFSHNIYHCSLVENTITIDSITFPNETCKVNATDADLSNNTVSYVIEEIDSLFSIDKTTGMITLPVATYIDYETNQYFLITVIATDDDNPPLSAISQVIVFITDINDETPVFDSLSHNSIWIPDSLPVNTLLFTAHAIDKDAIDNILQYSLLTETNTFNINHKTGDIILEDVQYYNNDHYDISILCNDNKGVSDIMSYSLNVIPINNNPIPPQFSYMNPLLVTVTSSTPIGTTVVQLNATDVDIHIDNSIEYYTIQKNYFSVNKSTGDVIVSESLIYLDDQTNIAVQVLAMDSGSPSLSSIYSLTVIVTVDPPPIFTKPEYNMFVPESKSNEEYIIGHVTALVNGRYHSKTVYSFTDSAVNLPFSINNTTGAVYINGSLDRESVPYYSFVVESYRTDKSDSKSLAFVIIIVTDFNDYSPHFPLSFSLITIPSSYNPSDEVFRIFTIDKDEGVNSVSTFSLSPSNSMFTINETTGIVYLQATPISGVHNITITASNKDFDISITVTDQLFESEMIHCNNSTIAIPENTPTGNVIYIMNASNETVFYQIDNSVDILSIHPSIGEVLLTKPLDREEQDVYHISVMVWDGVSEDVTNCSLIVEVTDVDDNRPIFNSSLYQFSIIENSPVGTIVGSIVAFDVDIENSLTHYAIEQSEYYEMFEINSTGYIAVIDLVDRELLPREIMLVASARDENDEILAITNVIITIIDDNDNRPVLIQSLPTITLMENVPIGTHVVTVTGLDTDLSSLTSYSLLNDSVPFVIDNTTGVITTSDVIDYETVPLYELNIIAIDTKDITLNNTTLVLISVYNLIDTYPYLLNISNSFSITENSQPHSFIAHVSINATPPHSLTYTLMDNDYFYIEPFSGVIRTLDILDYEEQLSHTLTVIGSYNDYFYSETNITVNVIDLNDNPPISDISNWTFVVSEGAIVAMETVFDLGYIDHDDGENGMIKFVHILEPECDEIFQISTTGEATLKQPLDRETNDFYHFTVFVTDNGSPPLYLQHTVTIIVTDINDNYPTFDKMEYTFIVNAPIIINETIFKVTATDIDIGSEITYELANGTEFFNVNYQTGFFYVHNNLHIQQSYSLLLIATDENGHNASVLVKIQIKYCSFNNLAFQPISYTVHMAEDTPIGALVLAPEINDFNQSGVFYYTITTDIIYFSINSSNGELYLYKEADFESINIIDLLIQVKDLNSSELRVGEVLVTIIITDVNDNAPLFTETPFAVFVRDDVNLGSVVFTATAIDKDANSTIMYSLYSMSSHDSMFNINSTSGSVTIVSLGSSFLHGERIELVIIASDKGKPMPLISNETLVVTLLNSNAPSFSQGVYSSTILESTTPTTVVLVIKAFSNNISNAQLFYTIVDNDLDVKFPFSIHPYNGNISVNDRGLDRELINLYQFYVEVEDPVLSLSTRVEVIINIEDINDEPPQFTQPLYIFSVNEDDPLNTVIGTVTATDTDTLPFAQIEYYILSENVPFQIDDTNGIIYNTMSLDYESNPSYQFSVYANDSGAIPLTSVCTIRVIINNINDNPPMINPPIDQLSVPEFPELEYFIAVISATDPDNDELSFDLVAIDGSENFIIFDNGFLQVRDNVTILPEPSYELTVTVSDQLYIINITISITVIDINDNSPVFSEPIYYADITENSPAGVYVATIAATDDDRGTNAQIDYSGNLEQFHVDSVTGVITTTTTNIDREESEIYNLVVIARDGGDRTDVSIVSVSVKDTNDNPPQFTQSSFITYLAEESDDLTPVLTVTALDPDEGINGTVSYQIFESNVSVPFIITSNTGLIRVQGDINYEVQPVWSFNVIATDGGGLISTASNVTINLINIADANPQFSEDIYTVSIPEYSGFNYVIFTPNVTYPEPCLATEFSIFASSSLPFAIDLMEGILKVAGHLERLSVDLYTFDIIVQCSLLNNDNNIEYHYDTAVVQVTITDVNDHPSVQATHSLSVSESAPINTTVVIITATDNDLGDNGTVRYNIKNSDDLPFKIDEITGVLITTDDLDRETNNFYNFRIEVFDLGTPSLSRESIVFVSIADENDSPPVFICENVTCFFNASIPEGTQKNMAVITLPIDDSDSIGNISFQLTNPAFSVKPVLDAFDKVYGGVINTVHELDREILDLYEFEVIVNDGIHNSKAIVLINIMDINDESPTFTDESYQVSIFENYPTNQIVVNITAIDNDEGINAVVTYKLLSIPQLNNISINTSTGELFFLEPPDYEISSQIDLLAQAIDNGGLSDTVAIVINILDLNDNAPVFSEPNYTVSIYENALYGTDIGYVIATDIDSGDNGLVLYYLDHESEYFQINTVTGFITSKQPLNRELNNTIEITVIAKDSAVNDTTLSASINVTITVLDINDNAPVFEEIIGNDYTATVSENADVNSMVLTVNAIDADIGSNADLSFLLSGDNSDDFHLKSVGNTVTIFVAQSLNHEGISDYNLLLSVVDNGIPSKETIINLYIQVLDENDNNPEFVREYEVTVPENAQLGSVILTVEANDLDSNDDVLLYSFLEEQDRFVVNTTTGDIIVNQPLDYETATQYSLTVIASEQRPQPKNASTQVVIIIQDINDNPPLFVCDEGNLCPVRQLTITENQNPPQLLGYFHVIDYDSVTNINAVSFTIASGSTDDNGINIFSIDALSGELVSVILLDREYKDTYELVIIANDNGSPSLSSSSNVTIIVNDLNDNDPIGEEQHMYVYLKNGELASDDLGTVAFTDMDIINNYQFVFETTSAVNWIRLSNEGMICLNTTSIEIGTHSFEIKIIDTLYDGQMSYTITTLMIKIMNVTEDTIHNSITMLISDLTPISFINYHLILFTKLVSSHLNVYIDEIEEIMVFSLINSDYRNNAIELQIALPLKNGNTSYLDKNLLLYYLFINRESIERQSQLNILTEQVDYCSSEPCSHNGLCSPDTHHYLSQSAINKHLTVVYLGLGRHTLVNCNCYAGKTGQTCSESTLSCDKINCGSNSRCIDTIGCLCDHGYVGESCDIPLLSLDLCDSKPCSNNSDCTSSHSGFTCTCQTGFTGTTCNQITNSYINGCYRNPCLHGGVCSLNDNSSYKCTCPNGYTGNQCEVFLYTRECPTECEGCFYSNYQTKCVVTSPTSDCQDIMCLGNTSCSVEMGVTTMCKDECLPNPCDNGGQCVRMFPGYYCRCPQHYDGPNCELIKATLSNENSFMLFPSIDLISSGEISLEFTTTDDTNGTILYASRPDTDSMDHLLIYISDEHVHCEISLGGEPLRFVFDEFPVTDGNWYTIVVYHYIEVYYYYYCYVYYV